MIRHIKNERAATDVWKILRVNGDDTPQSVRLPVGPLLVPLPVWQARRAELIHREYEHGWPLGVWLAVDDRADAIAGDIDDFTVIAIEFSPGETGRGHAKARQLRELHGYSNELRAIEKEDDAVRLWGEGLDARVAKVA